MALQVIGAGFGRTGTESMKRALEMLGYGPCYHMYEVMPHPERYEMWKAIYDGAHAPDWDSVFDGFSATVDWPACTYWQALAEHSPKAKVLLTRRSAESWYASMDRTILKLMRDPANAGTIGARLVERVFDGRIAPEDRDHVIARYERHNAEVQAAFGPERLLTYELGAGWAPLCEFLGKPVPDVPYPRGNAEDAFFEKDKTLSASRHRAQDDAP